jgi:oxalate decarboxylase/phosphoglucose isomerase-like protein (cupin superfamily)
MDTTEVIQFPRVLNEKGNLSFMDEETHIPFKIARCYWVYDVPGGEMRWGHAYKENQEVIIALSGSFDVIVNNGEEKKFSLNRSYHGLFLPRGTWRHLENFSTNSLCLVLADLPYDEADYIRDFNDFKQFIHAQ